MYIDDYNYYNGWYPKATDAEKRLADKVEDLREMFEDFLFKSGTVAYKMAQEELIDDAGNVVRKMACDIHPNLELFELKYWPLYIDDEHDCEAYYDDRDKSIHVYRENIDSDHVILHEMIHAHEDLLCSVPMFYRDNLYWSLYIDLREKIPNLDNLITANAGLAEATNRYDKGGDHGILFLLKSLDLDLRMGYNLGTVYAYGKMEEFKGMGY